MKSLKLALSTQQNQSKNSSQSKNKHPLLEGVNKSKSNIQWIIDIDNNEKISVETLNDDELMRLIYDKLQEAFHIDSQNLSEALVQRILSECQLETKQKKEAKNQVTQLQTIQDKILNLQELANNQFKKYLTKFNSRIEQKISYLKLKEKKSEIKNFDNIFKGNFQKRKQNNPYLNIQQQNVRQKGTDKKSFSKSPNRENKTNSVEKFKGLLGQQKNALTTLVSKKSQQDNNATVNLEGDNNVSFSSVLSTKMAVKSRRRKVSNEFKKQKPKKSQIKVQNEKQEEGDEAFIFFRPKKNKK